jgi:hypothetical protein
LQLSTLLTVSLTVAVHPSRKPRKDKAFTALTADGHGRQTPDLGLGIPGKPRRSVARGNDAHDFHAANLAIVVTFMKHSFFKTGTEPLVAF